VIRERTRTGLAAARARGRLGGRPRSLTVEQAELARGLREQGDLSMTEIAKQFGVGRTTLYRHLSLNDSERAA
jgi:DNA invertase Pin-like site-specific DNA recombinase